MQCRICLDDALETSEIIIAPCKCSGGSKYVHRTCIERWLNTTTSEVAKTQCMECNFKYRFRNQPSYLLYMMKRISFYINPCCYILSGFSIMIAIFSLFFKFYPGGNFNFSEASTIPINTNLSNGIILYMCLFYVLVHVAAICLSIIDRLFCRYMRKLLCVRILVVMVGYTSIAYIMMRYLNVSFGFIVFFISLRTIIKYNHRIAREIQHRRELINYHNISGIIIIPLGETPLGEIPLDEIPLDEIPLDETPLDEIPLDEIPLDETPLDEIHLTIDDQSLYQETNVPNPLIVHRMNASNPFINVPNPLIVHRMNASNPFV